MSNLLPYIAVMVISLIVGLGLGFMIGYDLAIQKGFRMGRQDAVDEIQPHLLAHSKLYNTMLDLGNESHLVLYLVKGGVRYATKGIDSSNGQTAKQTAMGQSKTSSKT